MIRRWFISGFLLLINFFLLKNFYTDAIMYDPFRNVKAVAVVADVGGKSTSPVYEPGWGREIINNNLFSPLRSPVKPLVKPSEMPKRPEMSLRGIVQDETGEYVAYIEKDKAKAIPVRKGDSLDDVKIIDIKEKSVELKWNDETISLSLEKIKTIRNRGK